MTTRSLHFSFSFLSCLVHSPLVFHFAVSQKINLLNQLTRQSSTGSNGGAMNNQRTLDLIREDLGHLGEMEGTYWDSRHPHLFVVMGASVSEIGKFSNSINNLNHFPG
jgi:hypothetical protein